MTQTTQQIKVHQSKGREVYITKINFINYNSLK